MFQLSLGGPVHLPKFISKDACERIIKDHEINGKSMTLRNNKIVFDPRKRKSKTKYISIIDTTGDCFEIKKHVDGYMLHEHRVFRSNMQLTKYEPNDFFRMHSDAIEKEQIPILGPQRLWTAVLYLNDEYMGGELVFPYKKKAFVPKQGDLVCWPNVDNDNKIIQEHDHCAMTVFNGTKYIAVFLYTERLNSSFYAHT